ncbi:MAG: Uncharacterised protein [Owenweeksia sp. TMED14]|nr:MAG: Uncharacterised protein [Owenweeksia sp. TMED14]
MKTLKLLNLISLGIILTGCEGYLGTKTDLGFIEVPNYAIRDIAYVPIQPPFTGFIHPSDFCVGFDELFYVVDAATEEIICLNESGVEQGRLTIPGVKHVRQDRRFDLLAIGSHDTTINGVAYSLSCIYRIQQLQNNGDYNLQNAQIIKKVIHPFYFKNTFSTSDAQVKFTQVAVLANTNSEKNNRYYASRSGPSVNNANQGPDDAVILFDNKDNYISPVSVSTSSGLYTNYFKTPSGLVSLAQPPQYTASEGDDFWYSSIDENQVLQIQNIQFEETDFGADYIPRIYPNDTSLSVHSINEPNRFISPISIAMAGDASRYLFVVDSEKDSLYQFTASGLEGIPPPPASGEKKYVQVSFGGTGDGPMQFNQPEAVAYWKKILYVVDAGNGRITRFKCTLDFE